MLSMPTVDAMLNNQSFSETLQQIHWELDKDSIALFKNARDGQGFSFIVNFDYDENYEKIMGLIILTPAFNGADGLVRENKLGCAYEPFETVDSQINYGQSGAGLIHRQSTANFVVKKELNNPDSDLAKAIMQTVLKQAKDPQDQTALRVLRKKILELSVSACQKRASIVEKIRALNGRMLGGGVIKGAESTCADDYQLYYATANDIIRYQRSFQNGDVSAFGEFKANNKYLVLCEVEQQQYEIYYIQNQKFVIHAQYSHQRKAPVISFDPKVLSQQEIVDRCLSVLNLKVYATFKNKSSSQNNATLHFTSDFEAFVMYLDEATYQLRDKDGRLRPEGIEAGALYDLRRSIPVPMMQQIAQSILTALDITPSAIETMLQDQQDYWPSWNPTQYPYQQVFNEFKHANSETKKTRYQQNINITVGLYIETLNHILSLCRLSIEIVIKASYDTEELKFQKYFKGIPQFKKIGSKDYRYFNVAIFQPYLVELQTRLDHLFFVYHLECMATNDMDHFHTAYQTVIAKFEYLREYLSHQIGKSQNTPYECKRPDQSPELERFCELISCHPLIDHHYKASMVVIEHLLQNLRQDPHQKKDIAIAQLTHLNQEMASAKQRSSLFSQFIFADNTFLKLMHAVYAPSPELYKQQKAALLNIIDKDSNQTVLHLALKNEWYDVSLVLLFHGAKLDEQSLVLLSNNLRKSNTLIFFKNYLIKIMAFSNDDDINFLLVNMQKEISHKLLQKESLSVIDRERVSLFIAQQKIPNNSNTNVSEAMSNLALNNFRQTN